MTINVNSELMEKKVDGMVCQTKYKHYKRTKILNKHCEHSIRRHFQCRNEYNYKCGYKYKYKYTYSAVFFHTQGELIET